jgi:hypothetical protein
MTKGGSESAWADQEVAGDHRRAVGVGSGATARPLEIQIECTFGQTPTSAGGR